MPGITYRSFSAEIPRMEAHLLPDTAASRAVNCTFEKGALAPLADGESIPITMGANPVRGAYTEDGVLFYTWPVETYAVPAPIYNDTYFRYYYLHPTVGVLTVGSTVGMAVNGPVPSVGVKAGVPRPTVAPTLALLERTTLPDYPTVAITYDAWWALDGEVYEKVAGATPTQVTLFRSYTLPTPTQASIPVDDVARAVLNVRMYWKDTSNGSTIATFVLTPDTPARTNAFPGTVEATMTIASTTATIGLTWGIAETRSYTYVYENTWQEEGSAAPAATIKVQYIQDVQITLPVVSSFSGYQPYSKTNIYRTYGTEVTYIKTNVTLVSGSTYRDSLRTADAQGNALESTSWFPPNDSLIGLVASPNGWFAVAYGNTVAFCEPYRPHAWPYLEVMPERVLGIKVMQGGLCVVTVSGVYAIFCDHPASRQQKKIDLPQSGIAMRCMVGIDGAVAYLSNDGIPVIEGSQGAMAASQKLFTRDEWQSRYRTSLADASMALAYHDGAIIGNSRNRTDGTDSVGFMIRLDEDVGSFVRLTTRFDGMYQLPATDTLYYSRGRLLYRFRRGDVMLYEWTGKEFIMPTEVNLGAFYIKSDGPVNMKVYVDGVERYNQNVDTGRHRLPSGFKGTRWQVALSGIYKVYQLDIARSMQELRQV